MLYSVEGVRQCVVLARQEETGQRRLVGYVVVAEGFDRSKAMVRLKELLPEYMLPWALVEVEAIPLTPNGKVDRRRLEEREITTEQTGYVAPRTPLEEQLAAIWQELLGVERVGIHDNFFDLGGHSLLAIRLLAAVRSTLKKEIAVQEIFTYPTIAGLGELLGGAGRLALVPAVERQELPVPIPLSFSQDRLWFVDRLQG